MQNQAIDGLHAIYAQSLDNDYAHGMYKCWWFFAYETFLYILSVISHNVHYFKRDPSSGRIKI